MEGEPKEIKECMSLRESIAELLKENNIDITAVSRADRRKILPRIQEALESVTDIRVTGRCRYSTSCIVLSTIIAKLSDRVSPERIASFWKNHPEQFSLLSKREDNATPCDDTFTRALYAVDYDSLESAVVALQKNTVKTLRRLLGIKKSSLEILAMDGKEEHGTGRSKETYEGGQRNVQVFHFFNRNDGICIRSVTIEEKSNEIPAAQKALAKLDLRGIVVTADAMNSQKKTVEEICRRGGKYLLGVKGNQAGLNEYCKSLFTEEKLEELKNTDGCHYVETDWVRGACETRECFIVKVTDKMKKGPLKGWKKVKTLVCRRTKSEKNATGEISYQTRYYISDLEKVSTIARVCRGHWAVESMHNAQDTVMFEDRMRTSQKEAVNAMSEINKLCVFLLELLQILSVRYRKNSKNTIIKDSTDKDWEVLFQLLVLLDPERTLKKYVVVSSLKQTPPG